MILSLTTECSLELAKLGEFLRPHYKDSFFCGHGSAPIPLNRRVVAMAARTKPTAISPWQYLLWLFICLDGVTEKVDVRTGKWEKWRAEEDGRRQN